MAQVERAFGVRVETDGRRAVSGGGDEYGNDDDVYVSSDDEGVTAFHADVEHVGDAAHENDARDDDDSDDAATRPRTGTSDESDDGSSSDSDAAERNTVGDVPMRWYHDYDHIGYDRDGERIERQPRTSKLQQLVHGGGDDDDDWRVIYDERNDEHVRVTDNELALIMRVRDHRYPGATAPGAEDDAHAGGDADGAGRERFIAWARNVEGVAGAIEPHPLFNATEPRRRFEPSRHERAKIVQLVRHLRDGNLKTLSERYAEADAARTSNRYNYDVWYGGGDGDAEDGSAADGVTGAARRGSKSARARSLMHVAPPKPPPPGHAESYNPPAEYLPTAQEAQAWRRAAPEDRRLPFLPQKFSSLRHVPAYEHYVHERFERCLDLYLCPRMVRQRVQMDDPDALLPQLPNPRELRPFPSRIAVRYTDRSGDPVARDGNGDGSGGALLNGGRVRCVSVHPRCGQWLATGSDDGRVRVWDVMSGRLLRKWPIGADAAAAAAAATAAAVRAGANASMSGAIDDGEAVRAGDVQRAETQEQPGDDDDDDDDGDDAVHRAEVHHRQRRAIADIKWVPGTAAPILAVACGARVYILLACHNERIENALAAWAPPTGYDTARGARGTSAIEALLPRRGDARVENPRGVRWIVDRVDGGRRHQRPKNGGDRRDTTSTTTAAAAAAAAADNDDDDDSDEQSSADPSASFSSAIAIEHPKRVKQITFHKRGDYFAVVAGDANGNTVYVHQVSRRQSQMPFRKRMSLVQCALFHPTKPFFFVATQHHIRVYSLAKQALVRRLVPGVRWISSMAVHPGGDNLICASYDKRVCWFDLDMGTAPYRVMRNHRMAVRAVRFHERAPLFASAGDDGAVHVFHGMVYDDLSKDPLLVPLRMLRGHRVLDGLGALATEFHPVQPWVFSVGADGQILLWVDE